jgi:cell division protein FtsB
MSLISRISRFDLLVTVACLFLLGSFAWHAWLGPRGFAYRDQLNLQVGLLQAKLDVLSKESQALGYRVSLLRPESVDPDMADEIARVELGFARGTDFVVSIDR